MSITQFINSVVNNLKQIFVFVLAGLVLGIITSLFIHDTYKLNARLIGLSGEVKPAELYYEPTMLDKMQLAGIQRDLGYPNIKHNKHNDVLTIYSDNKKDIESQLYTLINQAISSYSQRAIAEANDILKELRVSPSDNTAVNVAIAKYELRITQLTKMKPNELIMVRTSIVNKVRPSKNDAVLIFVIISFLISLIIIRFKAD